MSIAQRLVNFSDGLSADGILSAAKGGTGNTTGGGTTSPTISQIAYLGNDTATDVAGGGLITLTGTNFASGAKVLINTTQVSVVTVVSTTQITFTAPALAAGSYILYVVNLDGSTAIAVPGLQVSGVPAWTTAAGTLGTSYETAAISSALSATSNSAVTYSIFSGTLPSGATLNSNGTISGTSPLVNGSTTYTFTVRATDAELQDTDRQFSLTVNPDVVTWSSSNTVTLAQDTASTTTLLATSAAGQTVSYATDTLPTGLTRSGSVVSGTPTVVGTTITTATATAAVTGKTAQQTITWTVSVAADANWRYTTLLLNSENTTLPFATDASANNFAVTVVGDTKPSNFNPYTPGYYSNYFDGTGDSLTVTGNGSVVNFGTADFTIETWAYAANLSSAFMLMDTCPGGVVAPTNRIIFYIDTDGSVCYKTYQGQTNIIVSAAGVVKAAQWAHVALVKFSNQTKLYVNGTQVGSTYADTLNYPAQTNRPILSANGYDGGSYNSTGYLSNFRIVKGTAVYTANFTPPTQPLTAIANTSLLTCRSNQLVDLSTNAYTMTKTGDVAVSAFDPFTPNSSYAAYGSTYFDGTGDYLTVPNNTALDFNSDSWTIEFWANPRSASEIHVVGKRTNSSVYSPVIVGIKSNLLYILGSNGSAWSVNGSFGSGTRPVPSESWTHIAVVKNGTTITGFVNGVLDQTWTGVSTLMTNTNALSIGAGAVDGSNAFTGYISDLRIIKGTALYTAAFTPPSAPLTAITNTSLLTCQTNQPHNNSQFIDSSTLGGVVTRFGNTTQGSFSPYGANWSNYFDGTGDYLTAPAGTAAMGTGDFTVELWAYHTASGAWAGYYYQGEGGSGGGINFRKNDANKLSLSHDGVVDVFTTTASVPINQWTHIALTRSSGTVRAFIDGVLAITATYNGNFTGTSGQQTIGSITSGSFLLQGYISNLRVVKGTAVYTSAFTPPTQPLTAITGTEILTCQSASFVDNSPKAVTITKFGDTSTQKFSPFATVTQTPLTHSVRFDGTGDYLSIPTTSGNLNQTGDFTYEMWIYWNSMPTTGYQNIAGQGTGGQSSYGLLAANAASNTWSAPYVFKLNIANSGDVLNGNTTLVAGQWYHLAHTRTSGVNRLFVNGVVQTNTYTDSTSRTFAGNPYLIGNNSNGYISNFRFIQGTSLYTTTFTPPTSPLTAVSGTQLLTLQSSTFIDNSTNNFTITAFGNSQPTQQNPFGSTTSNSQDYSPQTFGGSMYFDNSGDYLALPTLNTYLIGSGDFTIECWVYKRSTTFDTILSYSSSTGLRIFVNSTGGLELWLGASQQWAIGAVVPSNTWNHIAFVRSGTTLTGYVNGTAVGTATVSTNYNAGTLNIGAEAGGNSWGGYISDFRIIRGQALYTANFVPPQTPLTASINTMLLINGDKSAIVDKSGKFVAETVGDARVSTAIKKYGNSSMYFDGTGDGLQLPITPQVYLGTTYTIEAWIYNAGGLNYQAIFQLCENNTGGFAALGLIKAGTTISAAVRTTTLGTESVITGGTLITNTWQHVALSVNAGSARLFLDGTQIGATTTFPEFPIAKTLFAAVGRFANGYTAADTNSWNGYIDDFRITKGVARYTANFTPPTSTLLTK